MSLYFDHAATTALHPEALAAMMPYLTEECGNPSGVYAYANRAKKALENARRQVAGVINAKPEEIIFTGSGTEADNYAIKGAAEALAGKGQHIITSAVEHPAVMHTCRYLENKGYGITYLPVDGQGFVSPGDLEKALRPDTVLVSVMLANNEIGTIQPLAELGEITRPRGILLHTDAVQAIGHIPVDVETLKVDMLTMSAHKFYGPKGVGALYVRKGIKLSPLLHGGAQESKRRAGTENVAGIVGMGAAVTIANEEMAQESPRLAGLRDRLMRGIEERIPHARLNGPRENRLPGNVNFSFEFVEGESLLLLLDMQGVAASSGSACSSASLDPSHVLLAIGVSFENAHGSLRFTLGKQTGEAEIDKLLGILPGLVEKLRAMSPLYEDYLRKQPK